MAEKKKPTFQERFEKAVDYRIAELTKTLEVLGKNMSGTYFEWDARRDELESLRDHLLSPDEDLEC